MSSELKINITLQYDDIIKTADLSLPSLYPNGFSEAQLLMMRLTLTGLLSKITAQINTNLAAFEIQKKKDEEKAAREKLKK